MATLSIDNQQVTVPDGTTILDAATAVGIEIPTLCHYTGCKPQNSCLLCVVKISGHERLVPACSTVATHGALVESDSDEVRDMRRTALELLLSDHIGNCLAPCHNTCPAHMDIPQMIRQIAAGDLHDALVTVKQDIPLPAVLGRICSAPCEAGCTRKPTGGAVAVCLLKRFVADEDLASQDPYVPPRRAATGRKVAIFGAGPAGLSAGYYLQQAGHECTVFDQRNEPGGMLRYGTSPDALPRRILDGEIDIIRRLGVKFVMNICLGEHIDLIDLRRRHDAVLIATGHLEKQVMAELGIKYSSQGVAVDSTALETAMPGVFAAGSVVRQTKLAVRSVADGKAAAVCIDQYLAGDQPAAPRRPFSVQTGRLSLQQVSPAAMGASDAQRQYPHKDLSRGFSAAEALSEAQRCMQCACASAADCRLRRYCADYQVNPAAYRGAGRQLAREQRNSSVVYEPGKCICCGLCVDITERGGEPLGLTHIGRGFDVRIDVPFNASLEEALGRVAGQCVRACPTGALTMLAGQRCEPVAVHQTPRAQYADPAASATRSNQ